MQTVDIPIEKIQVINRLRKTDEHKVDELVSSIQEIITQRPVAHGDTRLELGGVDDEHAAARRLDVAGIKLKAALDRSAGADDCLQRSGYFKGDRIAGVTGVGLKIDGPGGATSHA